MSHRPFALFCQRICSAVGAHAPPLDFHGPEPAAFGLSYRDVAIRFSLAAHDDADAALLMIDFGALPLQGASEAAASLLRSNFLMAGAGAPTFGIDPSTDRVVYSLGFSLSDADATAFCANLDPLVATVHQWRATAMAAKPRLGDTFV